MSDPADPGTTAVRPSLKELLTPTGLRSPTDTYAAWRRWEAEHGTHPQLVLSHAAVSEVYADRHMSAARIGNVIRSAPDEVQATLGPLEAILSSIIAFQDPPDHTRIRSTMSKAFTPRVIRHQEAAVERIAARLVGDMAESGDPDVVRAVSDPMPAQVIGAMLGLPDGELPRFATWAQRLVFFVGSSAPSASQASEIAEALGEMHELLTDLAARRRAEPTDDLFSSMLAVADAEDGAGITDDELFANTLFLMTAGHETATNAITNGLLALLRHPDQRARLGAEPELIDGAVEEMLRFDSPIQISARLCDRDRDIAGRSRRAGDPVVLVIGAANHDPAVFDAPERFDIGRDEGRHLSFGHGRHHCLGAALARSEMRVVIPMLLRAFPSLGLVDEAALEWQPTLNFRGVRELEVAW
ncbi:MAG: cytochrome P450 [Actinomycetota bacterium]